MNLKKIELSICLIILSLFLCACGNSAEQVIRTGDDSVMLSNILFPDMSMSEEEKNLLHSVDEILFDAVIKKDGDAWVVTVVNTSGKALNIQFILQGYNEDNILVASFYELVDDWNMGTTINIARNITGAGAIRWEIGAMFETGDHYIRTDCYPLTESQNSKELSIELDGEFPYYVFFGDSVYLLTDLKLINTGTYTSGSLMSPYYNLELYLTKESGSTKKQESIYYRILTKEEGTVIISGSIPLYGIVEGEQMKIQESYLTFLPDITDYVLQIMEG